MNLRLNESSESIKLLILKDVHMCIAMCVASSLMYTNDISHL